MSMLKIYAALVAGGWKVVRGDRVQLLCTTENPSENA